MTIKVSEEQKEDYTKDRTCIRKEEDKQEERKLKSKTKKKKFLKKVKSSRITIQIQPPQTTPQAPSP